MVSTKSTNVRKPLKQKKLLCYSDSVFATTGFGIVSKHILNALHHTGRYNISQLAINHPGEFWNVNETPYSILPAKMLDPRDPYGSAMFLNTLKKDEYDVVLIINDTFVVDKVAPAVQEIRNALVQAGRKAFKIVYYYPVDCQVIPDKAGMIKIADYPVPYTKFALNETVKSLGDEYENLQYIYHGADTSNFHPIHPEERRIVRKEAFGADSDTFLVINVNRNNTRKDIGKTILTFAEFHKTVPNSKLYLHMAPQDQGAGPATIDLFPLINQLGLKLDEDVYFPRNFNVASGYPIELLNKLYCCGDVYITTTTGEGFGLCVHPETLINKLNGFQEIQNIKINDFVMSHDGRYHRVLDKISRQDDLIALNITKHPVAKVTPQHPFLAVKSGQKDIGYDKRNLDFSDPQWIKAKNLESNDWIAVAKPKTTQPLIKKIDLVSYVDGIEYDNQYIWFKMGYSSHKNGLSIKDIQKKYNISRRVAEDARRCILGTSLKSRGRAGSKAFDIAQKINKSNQTVNNSLVKINRYLNVNDNFLNLVGWYIAEGSNSAGRGIELDFHIKEWNIAQRLGEYLKSIFGLQKVRLERNGKNKCRLYASSGIVSTFFGKFCGIHSNNKKIPHELYRSYNNLSPLVKGLLMGDGYIRANGISIELTSREAIWQLRDIFLANNIFPSITGPYTPQSIGNFKTWKLSLNGESYQKLCDFTGINYEYTSKRKPAAFYIENKNFFFVRIRSIEKIGYHTVYDLSVEDSHSFIGQGVVLHNTTVDSFAAGTPVVCPDNTVFPEIVGKNYERAYVYKCKEMVYNDNSGKRPIGRLEDIYNALLDAYTDWRDNTKRRANITENARKFALKYSWNNVCKDWVKLFNKIDYSSNQFKQSHQSDNGEVL